MKKTLSLIIGAFIIICSYSPSFSQADFEGEIVYEFKFGTIPDQPGIENFLPKEMKLSVKDNKTRMDQSFGSSGNSQFMVYDYSNNVYFIATDMMGNKMLINIDEQTMDEGVEKNKNSKVEYIDEYKDILGYKCQKAIISTENETLTVYFTDALPNKMNRELMSLKGMPLQYSVTMEGMDMTISATSIVKKVINNASFDKPSGYQEMSIKDIQQMGMGNIKF